MAQNIGGDGLGVGVICENGRQSVMVMLPGEDLASRSVVARWSDGTENEYNFRLTSDGYLMGTTATVNFRQMITKLRRLNSVTLTVGRSGDGTLTDTISLAGSSRAIGRISCGGPREPRRASRATTQRRPAPRPAAAEPSTGRLTAAQRNAVRSANAYLRISGFSRQGLIDQLSSDFGDGYSVGDATVAVNSLSVDWNRQAARSADLYLSMAGFSCQGLIEQLSSDFGDKYTMEQATYGATQAGIC